MKNENENEQRQGGGAAASKKLLAAVAVLAMVLCAFAIVAPTADAAEPATYWVDTNKGSDDADGSQKAPFKSFDKAFEATAAGDKVMVADGSMAGNDFVIPAGEIVVVPASVTFQCNGTTQIIGTLDVSGTLKFMGDRSTISGADKTGACNIVINGGAAVSLNTNEIIGSGNDLAEGSKLVISKLETKDENGNYGYTATLESGTLTLNRAFIVGPNTNLTIAEGATVEVDSALTNNGSITNNGTLSIGNVGTVDSDDGKFTNNGEVALDGGTFKGSISSGKVSFAGTIDGKTRFPDMKGATFLANGNEYLVFDYEFNGNYYQYGLAVKDIAYNGTEILSDELSVIPIALPEDDTTVLTIYNTSASWYTKEKGVYKGALEVAGQKEDSPDAGYYEDVVYFEGSIDSTDSDGNTIFKGNTLSKFIGLTVTKGQYDAELEIEGWNLGEYDEKKNAPTVTVTDADGKLVPADDYTVTYEYFSDSKCTKSEGTDPLKLQPGTYWVKATVVPDNKNYEVKKIDAVEFNVERASEVEFHPIQDLDDSETEKAILGGVDPNTIQKDSIKFNSIGKNADGQNVLRVSGTVYKIAADAKEFTTLKTLFNNDS